MSIALDVSMFAFSAAAAIVLLFAAYPTLLALRAAVVPERKAVAPESQPRVSLLVVVRNAAALLPGKIQNGLGLDYPRDRIEFIFHSDGSTDGTEAILAAHAGPRFVWGATPAHDGKQRCLNRAISLCTGEIVVFSDADALLEPDSVRRLVSQFGDAAVGGVSGRTELGADETPLRDAQAAHLGWNARLKTLESRVASITSNDGKLYAMRRELYRPIPDGASDDLFTLLSVVAGRRRFVFEPRALARIRVPARSPAHEIERRRRVVVLSLGAVFSIPEVLNPFRHGTFSLGLIVNKLVKRLVPFALLALVPSSVVAASRFSILGWVVAVEAAAAGLVLLHPWLRTRRRGGVVRRAAEVAYFVALGQLGTLLGIIDYARGRQITRWEPVKSGTDR